MLFSICEGKFSNINENHTKAPLKQCFSFHNIEAWISISVLYIAEHYPTVRVYELAGTQGTAARPPATREQQMVKGNTVSGQRAAGSGQRSPDTDVRHHFNVWPTNRFQRTQKKGICETFQQSPSPPNVWKSRKGCRWRSEGWRAEVQVWLQNNESIMFAICALS